MTVDRLLLMYYIGGGRKFSLGEGADMHSHGSVIRPILVIIGPKLIGGEGFNPKALQVSPPMY